jgi:hypothetical protein
MAYQPPSAKQPVEWNGRQFVTQASLGEALKAQYGIRNARLLTSCSTCHR